MSIPIYVRARLGRDPAAGRETGEVRAALVMVSAFERGDASLRLVQDFGRPEDGGRNVADCGQVAAPGEPSPTQPPKRGRGRPPGSKSKPKAA